MLRFHCLWVLAAAALLSAGCTSKANRLVTVSGTVTLDGQPMRDGEITFVGTDGTVPQILPVVNGTFKGEVKVGKKRVEVRAYRDAKAQAAGNMYRGQEPPGGPSKENYLPAQFNSESQLTAEVTPAGLSPSAFDVTSR